MCRIASTDSRPIAFLNDYSNAHRLLDPCRCSEHRGATGNALNLSRARPARKGRGSRRRGFCTVFRVRASIDFRSTQEWIYSMRALSGP